MFLLQPWPMLGFLFYIIFHSYGVCSSGDTPLYDITSVQLASFDWNIASIAMDDNITDTGERNTIGQPTHSRIHAPYADINAWPIVNDTLFPLFNDNHTRSAMMEFVLHQGDALYIPLGWWHWVSFEHD
jgi:hypothetical protein